MSNPQDLIEELTRLAKSEGSIDEFYRQLLPQLTAQLGALGAAIWFCDGDAIRLSYQHGTNGPLVTAQDADRHMQLLSKIRIAGHPAYVLPKSADSSAAWANPTEYLLGISPVKVDDNVVALIQSFHGGDGQPTDQEAGLRLLRTVAGVASRFHLNFELRKLRERQQWWSRFEVFSQAAHASLHPTKTAFAIANEGRQILGCDRLSVLLVNGRRCRVTAISGMESVNRRANSVVLLRKLAERAIALGEPFYYPSQETELMPQLEDAVEDYVDDAQSKSLIVFPLMEGKVDNAVEEGRDIQQHRPRIIAALVAEQFTGESISPELMEAVAGQARDALSNALQHHQVFLLPLWSAVGSLVKPRNLPGTFLVGMLLAVVVLMLVFVRVDFDLAAEGSLQPELRRNVFAHDAGVIDKLFVGIDHGTTVSEGTPLVELRSSDVDLQLAEIDGELETSIRKLAATKAARVAASELSGVSRDQIGQRAAEEAELVQWIASLEQQRDLLRKRKESLVVKSPIDGEVITWDLENQLTARPVSRGEVLMTVAQTEGFWVLELLLPDHRVGHLRDASSELGDELDVTFILATHPGKELNGKIKRIGTSTVVDEDRGVFLPVTVEIDKLEVPDLRTGAKVSAKIHCGKRAVGYVWLHELFEFVQSRVLFRF